jgi:hypothetical protein
MTSADIPLKSLSFGETMRRDAWWIQPLLVFAGLTAFIVYSTWAALQNAYYHGENSFPLIMGVRANWRII